jgi:hypothetical protein
MVPNQRNVETNEYQFKEEDFPPLSTAQNIKVFDNKPGTSFASLAKDWSSVHFEQMAINEIRKREEEERERARNSIRTPLPKFKNFHRFIDTQNDVQEVPYEVTYEHPEDEEKPVAKNEDDEGWVTVERRKRRKVKHKPTIEEIANKASDSEQEEEQEDTVWNVPEEEGWQKY